jgi:hypothetical protein
LFDRGVAAVAAAAFAVRAAWVLLVAELPDQLRDPFLYHGYALHIAAGLGHESIVGFPTAYYPPGYPYFLGGVYWVIDRLSLQASLVEVVGLAQALLWAVAAAAVCVAGRAAFGRRAGLAAGLVLALWPNLVSYAGAWLSENLFVALFAVAVAAMTVAARCAPGQARRFGAAVAVAAVAVAGATMVRPQVLLGMPLVALAWLAGGVGWRRSVALASACLVATAALVVPWAIRNESVFGHVVLVSTNGGDNLCVGFHPGAPGSFAIPEYCDTGEFWNDGPDAEYRRNAETRERALRHIRAEPASLPWLSVRKLWFTYKGDEDGLAGNESYGAVQVLSPGVRRAWLAVVAVGYAAIMALALAGAVGALSRAVRRPRDAAVMALGGLLAAGALVPVLFFGDQRFKVPTTPLFALFAGWAAVAGLDAWRRRRARRGHDAPLPDEVPAPHA